MGKGEGGMRCLVKRKRQNKPSHTHAFHPTLFSLSPSQLFAFNQRPYAFVGQDFQQQRVFHATVDDMH